MHIILIAPPKENLVSTVLPEDINKERGLTPPLGLLYVASYIKENSSHKITVIDCEVERLDYYGLKERINALKPDLVGIQALTFTLIDALNAASIVKEVSRDIPVVFGGPHVTIFPSESLMYKDVDYIVRGEGEISFKRLVDNLNKPEELAKINGVGFKKDGVPVLTKEPNFIENLDELPLPDRTLTPYKKYYSLLSKNFPITTMMTSRGCPYNCIFCERMGKKFRPLSPSRVLDEIEGILKLGIKEIFLHDDTFSVNKKRVLDICKGIAEKGLKFDWDARCRVDTVDKETLSMMKKAGCKRISFGVESGSEIILKNLRKGTNLEKIEQAFKITKGLGITTLADFMIGSPGETRDDIRDTLGFMRKLKPDYVQFSITSPYPGTDLYKDALRRKIIERDVWLEFAMNPDKNFTSPLWTENFSREELLDLLRSCFRSFYLSPSFLIKELTNIRSGQELMKKVRAGFKLLYK